MEDSENPDKNEDFSLKPKPYVCEFCEASFTLSSNMNRHIIRMHKFRRIKYGSMKCPIMPCEFWCESRRDLRVHLNEPCHNITFSCYKRTFPSMKDFLEWKAAEEEATNTHFISLSNGCTRSNGVTPFYYVCHRSGFHYREESSSLGGKQKRMAKINGTCPAAIRVSVFQGKVNVVYHKTHVGHDFDAQYLKLRKFEKDYIAGKLLQGFSFEKVMQDIKNDESLVGQRMKSVNRKDLHNIMKSYRVELNGESFIDLKNIEDWVGQMKNFPSSPVLIYKPCGLCLQHLNLYKLLKRDFMLSLMTDGQQQVFEMLPQSVMGVCCSRDSNSHGFFLVTVFVVDQSGIPFPVAYCFTNRYDGMGMKAFFNAIRNRVGRIEASLLISDCSHDCYSAWVRVMGAPFRRAFYFPSLLHHWKYYVSKTCENHDKRKKIYDSLVALTKEPDQEQFELLLKSFLNQTECDDDLKEFLPHFKSTFLSEIDVWSACHYAGDGMPTVSHLEEMDKKLHDVCFHDGFPKGVDLSIRELLVMTHTNVYEHVIDAYRGTDFLEQIIMQDHKNNEQLYSCEIEYSSSSGKWKVQMADDDSTYSVQKIDEHLDKRELYCPLCKAFLDMYYCNCIDYLVMCKVCEHVHAVACSSEPDCGIIYSNEVSDAVDSQNGGTEEFSCQETMEISEKSIHPTADLTVANFEVVV